MGLLTSPHGRPRRGYGVETRLRAPRTRSPDSGRGADAEREGIQGGDDFTRELRAGKLIPAAACVEAALPKRVVGGF